VEELGRFITAPILGRLNQIYRQLTESAARVRRAHATRVRQRYPALAMIDIPRFSMIASNLHFRTSLPRKQRGEFLGLRVLLLHGASLKK
jgi:hypothetical protein